MAICERKIGLNIDTYHLDYSISDPYVRKMYVWPVLLIITTY